MSTRWEAFTDKELLALANVIGRRSTSMDTPDLHDTIVDLTNDISEEMETRVARASGAEKR